MAHVVCSGVDLMVSRTLSTGSVRWPHDQYMTLEVLDLIRKHRSRAMTVYHGCHEQGNLVSPVLQVATSDFAFRFVARLCYGRLVSCCLYNLVDTC